MKKTIFAMVFLLLVPLVYAGEGHMYLLAVKETADDYTGSLADLYLEVGPGSGRVFMETFPLSKLDTQISTRFAKEIACDYLEKDCDDLDFFYTIKADSAIIGGPSAGAALATLTVAVLEGIDIDESVAITGTINSGGLIGPVSGLKAKIDAAPEADIKKVLVPKGKRFLKEENNFTLDLNDYAKKYGIEVTEVSDLTDSLYEFTGKRFREPEEELVISQNYLEIMKGLAEMLCNRSELLQEQVGEFILADSSIIDEEFSSIEEKGVDYITKGNNAFKNEIYYSSASYCFGANVKYRELLVELEEFKDFDGVEEELELFEQEIEEVDIKTITDLEAYMIVKERLKEAREYFNKSRSAYQEGDDYYRDAAYSIERIYSAESWSGFFGAKGKEFKFDEEALKQGCLNKLSEAEERYQYAKIFFPRSLRGTKKELDYAYDDLDNGDYELCMFKASKAKAEADVILSVVGIEESQLADLLENKLDIVEQIIAREHKKGIFPILGYSYYEYANTLKEDDQFSALLYSEYALELSNLEIYFKSQEFKFFKDIDLETFAIFISGAVIGASIVFLIKKGRKKRKRK